MYKVKKREERMKKKYQISWYCSAVGVLDHQRASCTGSMNINLATDSVEQKASQPGLSRIEHWLNTNWTYWSWASHLSFLNISFTIYKIRVISILRN